MFDPGDGEYRQEFCRICSKTGINLRHLFNDLQLKREVLPKIHIVFPHILIYENDPLPKGLCEDCELFVYATHKKLLDFNKAQQELVTREIDVEENIDYLKAFNTIHTLLDRIQDIKNDLLSKSKQSIAKLYKRHEKKVVQNVNLRSLLLNEGKVRTLKRLCIDFFNRHGPELVESYLKCETPLDLSEEDISEDDIPVVMISKKGKNRRRMNYQGFGSKKKKRFRSVRSVRPINEPMKPKKIVPKSPTPVIPSSESETKSESKTEQEGGPATRRRSRALSRVNYVDDIPDSVLFYDEIQAAKRRKIEEKVILESLKDAVKQPVVPPLIIRVNNLHKSGADELFKTNPESEIKINSAISFETPIRETGNTGIVDLNLPEINLIPLPKQSDNLLSEKDILPPEMVNLKSECPLCGLICDNLKILAIHNMEHLSLRLRRIGEKESLPANLRRGVMIHENGYRVVRCTNCLKSFKNADQIKQHWNTMNCDYYCKICYLSFHRDPAQIRDHMLAVHGIRTISGTGQKVVAKSELQPLDLLENMSFERITSSVKSSAETSSNASSGSSPSGFKLKVKSVSMINASASSSNDDFMSIPEPDPTYLMNEVPEIPPLQYPSQVIRPQVYPINHQYHPNQMQQQQILPQISNQRAVCHICHCSFPNINSRNSHMKIHKRLLESSGSRPPPLAVPVMSQHINDFTVKVNFAMRPCGFRYYNRVEFIQHRAECKECRYSCTMCVKTFQSGSELQMHMMLTHPRSLTFKR